jgi:hypothetical protein
MISLGVGAPRCVCQRPTHNLRRLFSVTASRQAKSPARRNPDEPRDKWNYNYTSFNEKPSEEHIGYKLVNANALETGTTPPRKVKMLARDFIEDSLYNPNYGYFPKQATILDTQDHIVNFTTLRDSAEFQEEVGQKYAAYGADRRDGPGRQLWHTPTELFKARLLTPSLYRLITYLEL